jgi:hypothetical protein
MIYAFLFRFNFHIALLNRVVRIWFLTALFFLFLIINNLLLSFFLNFFKRGAPQYF